MKLSTMFALVICMLFAFSCGKKSGDGKNTNQEKNESNSHEQRSGEQVVPSVVSLKFERIVSLEKLFKDPRAHIRAINSYIIKAVIKDATPDTQLVCYRLVFNQRYNKMEALPDDQQIAKIRTELSDRDPNEVEYECSVTENGNVVFSKNFKMYKSFAVEGFKILSKLGISQSDKIGTLFITEDSTLILDDKDFNLEVQDLISSGGTIATFEKEEVTRNYDDSIGLSGGSIHIKAQRSFGQLNIELRGKNGGPRTTSPKDKTERLAADPNLNGKCRHRSDGGSPNRNIQACFGKKGHRGVKGEKGYEGFPGGDTGKLIFEVKEQTDLKLNVLFEPGKGSPGSKGGKGGFGSPGGIGQTVSWTTYGGCGREGPCNTTDHYYTYPHGAEGDRGEDGDRGDSGEDGKILASEINLAGEKFLIENNWHN